MQDSIEQLGYNPNIMARIFKTGKKYLIGFVVPDISNIFFANIIEEIENVIAEKNYRLIVTSTKENADLEREHIRTLSNGIVDGLIVASTLESYSQIQELLPDSIPTLFIDRTLKDCPEDSVIISNYDAMYKAVETLIANGHSQIGYITGLPHLSTTQERLSAYYDAMLSYHIPVNTDFIYTGTSVHNTYDSYIEKILAQGCTALIVSNNVMTEDILYYLDKNKMFGKIALVGYNDSDYLNYALRRIYSISQPASALGQTAGRHILAQIEHQAPPQHEELCATFSEPKLWL